MPSFKYVASDSQGHRSEGLIDAPSVNEAARLLAARGLRVSQVLVAPTPAQPQASASQQPVRSSSQGPVPRTTAAPVSPVPVTANPVRRTKRGSAKDVFFIFTQLASYAQSGVNPVQAAGNLSQKMAHPGYAASLQEVSALAREGGRMSDVFARYPDLYPPHVAGTVRVGEESGALPEALRRVAEQAHQAHRMGKLIRWLGFLALAVVLVTPLGFAFARAGAASWDVQEVSGGTVSGFSSLGAELGRVAGWLLPLTLGILILGWGINRLWMSLPNQRRRHRAALWIPTLGKRSKAESAAALGWALSHLARGGTSPKSSWSVAASAVPNLILRDELEEIGASMSDRTKLSEALARTRLLPEEFGFVVETGETTGVVSGSLADVARMAEQELRDADLKSRMRLGCWMALVVGIGSAIMFGILYGVFYRELIPKILGE